MRFTHCAPLLFKLSTPSGLIFVIWTHRRTRYNGTLESDSEPELIAERVLKTRVAENGGTEYLIVWKGFIEKKKKGLRVKSLEKASWKPKEDLNIGALVLIAAFENDSSSTMKQGNLLRSIDN